MSTQALVRRSFAMVVAALLAVAFAVAGVSAPASAAPVKGSLDIVSITDRASGLGAPVQSKPFDVVIRVFDTENQPMTVTNATTILLEEDGDGTLGPNRTATIPRNGNGATILGATYSEYENGVTFRVRVQSGVELSPDEMTLDVAATAVGANASPHKSLKLTDSNCSSPTPELPTCGSQLLLPEGANGHVTLSAGSCEGLADCRNVGNYTALVVTAMAVLKDADGTTPLYSNGSHATAVLACDKVLCGQSGAGLPQIKVIYTFDNDGDLGVPPSGGTAPACPAKGVLGADQDICVDLVNSTRNQGDLYTPVLFDHDLRLSHP